MGAIENVVKHLGLDSWQVDNTQQVGYFKCSMTLSYNAENMFTCVCALTSVCSSK